MTWQLIIFSLITSGVLFFVVVPLIVDRLIRFAPLDETPTTRSRKMGSKKARITHLIQCSKHPLDQLDAIEAEFLSLHPVHPSSDAADELRRVIRDREDYALTLKRLNAKAKR